jgi:hypothetical protein
VISRLQFTTTEGCPDTFDQIVCVLEAPFRLQFTTTEGCSDTFDQRSLAQTCGTTEKFNLENNATEIYFLKSGTCPFKRNSIVPETTVPSAASERNRSG